MSLVLMEGAIAALKSYFEDTIADKLDVLDAEYDDGIVLADIQKFYEGNFPRSTPATPSVILHGESFDPEEQEDDTLYIKNYINITVVCGDADPEVRFKRLSRYTRAFIELLQEGEATYGYIHWLEGRVEVSNTLAVPPFLQAAVLPISLYPASGESY